MVKIHKVNLKQSEEVYKAAKDIIKIKECYDNIFKLVTFPPFIERFTSGKWKIGFGYMDVLNGRNLMARHAFIINENDEVIDPTIASTNRYLKADDVYISFSIMSLHEYLDKLETEMYTDLQMVLMDKQQEARKWASVNQKYLLG